jgi:uncharacterized protein (TIGR03437 family)
MNMSIGKLNRAFTGVFLGLILCAAPGFAQRPANRRTQHPQQPQIRKTPNSKGRGLRFAPNRYILFLGDEPVAAHFATHDQLQTAAAISYRQQIESRQQSVMQDLAGRKIQVAGSVSVVMNAIFVVATPDRLAELRSVPGVIGVMPERSIQPDLNKATTLANAPAAWAQSAIGGQGNAGSGIKIAILDTGIDAGSVHTNPAFNDAGFNAPSGFPKCNTAVSGTPSDCGLYTNNKVIVARSYVSMTATGNCAAAGVTGPCSSAGTATAADSMPDDYSARDRDGHGSAVAAVAAAVQNSAGTVAFSGMAPKAYLGSYKIYGSDGVSYSPPESVIIKALDDAVSDGMNVVNFSSGTPAFAAAKDDVQCGNATGVWCDPLAHAFEVAAENGTVITAAAGNFGGDPYGDLYYNTILSPATAPSVISVGATINSHVFNPTVSVNGSVPANLKNITAGLGDSYFSPSIVGANSGVLVDITQPPINDSGQACSALPAGSLTDAYALIQRSPTGTGCSFDTKAQNAVAAGAIGIVFYMADASTLPNPFGTICYANTNDECDMYGPAAMISLSDGQNVKAYIDANPGTTVTIDTAGAEEALPNTSAVNNLASYSSEGPAIDGSIKPDMVATGGFDDYQSFDPSATNGMYTVGQSYDPNGELYTTNGFAAANGTSFAAPMVAGTAALVIQAHPKWTAAQVKSALVNYADQTVTSDDNGNTVDVQEIGAGLLDANAAVTASVTAVPSTLSFGYLATGTTLPKTIPVTVSNLGTTSVTLAAAVVAVNSATGATVSVSSSSLTVAAGATGSLTVSLSGSVPAGGEYSGAVTLTSSSPAISLRLPYMFLVGDGLSPVVNPLFDLGDWQVNGYTLSYGAVNQDIGPLPVQVLDELGVPIAGTSVSYTVGPTNGTVTLKPIQGTPGSTGSVAPFQPPLCSPSTSSSTLTCTTNNYGLVGVELVDGSTAVGDNGATVDICYPAGACASAQVDITDYVSIIPAPVLTSVTDDAAYGSTIAPGSYITLFGSTLVDPNYLSNPTTGDKVDVTFSSGRLPLTWDYVTVSFDAPASGSLPAISVPGYVEYVNVGQINAFVPWELENYPSVNVKMTYAGSDPIFSNVISKVPVSNYTPAFFMYNSGSVFIADALDNTTYALITTANPATPGEVLQLYCNGLGPTTNQPASGNPAPSGSLANLAQTTTPVTVSIGGQSAQVLFAGLEPPYVGLYLVDIIVPSGVAAGNQPITVSVGGKTSPGSITASGTTYQIVLPIK